MSVIPDHNPYLDWDRLGHHAGCKSPGFEVHRKLRERLTRDELDIRAVCTSCGAAHLIGVTLPNDPDAGYGHGWEITTTDRLGFGAPPLKVAGLYLWPGPSLDYTDNKPLVYEVTRSADRPQARQDIAGTVSQYVTPRHAHRWRGAAGFSPASASEDGFTTPRAAARWVAGQLQEVDE